MSDRVKTNELEVGKRYRVKFRETSGFKRNFGITTSMIYVISSEPGCPYRVCLDERHYTALVNKTFDIYGFYNYNLLWAKEI